MRSSTSPFVLYLLPEGAFGACSALVWLLSSAATRARETAEASLPPNQSNLEVNHVHISRRLSAAGHENRVLQQQNRQPAKQRRGSPVRVLLLRSGSGWGPNDGTARNGGRTDGPQSGFPRTCSKQAYRAPPCKTPKSLAPQQKRSPTARRAGNAQLLWASPCLSFLPGVLLEQGNAVPPSNFLCCCQPEKTGPLSSSFLLPPFILLPNTPSESAFLAVLPDNLDNAP